MKKSKCTFTFAVILVCTIMCASAVNSSTAPIRNLNYKFEPLVLPNQAGPVKLELSFIPKYGGDKFTAPLLTCDEAEIRITELQNIIYTGDTSWVVQIDSGKWFITILDVEIPPNDTSEIRIEIRCGRIRNPSSCYFVTTGDTVEFYKGRPRSYRPSDPPVYDYHHPKRDTLTIEQLNKKYTIWLNLQKNSHLVIAKRILGELPDSCKSKEYEGVYIMEITLDEVFKLGDEGIDLDAVNWDEFSHRKDTTSPSPQKTDSTRGSPQLAVGSFISC